ncbi:MAG: hypothetical protein ACI9AP_001302, partial [Flavobacteriales bacterium]
SLASLETQLGLSGHCAKTPSETPKLDGRLPEQDNINKHPINSKKPCVIVFIKHQSSRQAIRIKNQIVY